MRRLLSLIGFCILSIQPTGPASAELQSPVQDGRPDFRCPSVNVDSLSPAYQQAATEAVAEACTLFQSEGGRQKIMARDYVTGCNWHPFGEKPRVSGQALYTLLATEIPDFTIKEGSFSGSTTASTSIANRRVTLRTERFDGWLTGRRDRKANLVNTIAHEMTHLVPRQGSTNLFRFTDAYHGRRWCPDDGLVSYGVGQIIEDLWLAAHP